LQNLEYILLLLLFKHKVTNETAIYRLYKHYNKTFVKYLKTSECVKVLYTSDNYEKGGEVVMMLKILKKEVRRHDFISILVSCISVCSYQVFPFVCKFVAEEKHEKLVDILKGKVKTMSVKWDSRQAAATALWCYNDPQIDSWLLNSATLFSSLFLSDRNFDNIFFGKDDKRGSTKI